VLVVEIQPVDSGASSGTQRESVMATQAALRIESSPDDRTDYNFAPDFAWALIGGLVVLGVSALLYSVFVTWGGMRLDVTMLTGEAVPLSAYPRELAGLLLGGGLAVLVARTLNTRTH
jgi:hypothetical protein